MINKKENTNQEEKNNLEWQSACKNNINQFLKNENILKEEEIVFIKNFLKEYFNIIATSNEIEMMWSDWSSLNRAMFKKINMSDKEKYKKEIINATKYFINYNKKSLINSF